MSIAGGYDKALDRVKAIGGNALQIFSGSPRIWRRPEVGQSQIDVFKRRKKELGIDPVVFHSLYLVNLASLTETARKSIDSLIWELNLASKMGVIGSIVHLGSYLKADRQIAYSQMIKNIVLILDNAPDDVFFIAENAAGNKVGQTKDELFRIVKDLKDDRIGVCWDTCHGFAAGIDLSTKEKLDRFIDSFDKEIGFDKLLIWHFNDSRDSFNSHRDRHANIGQGYIGLETFSTIINHPLAGRIPIIIETPGFDNHGPDKENLDILKGLKKEA